MTHRMLQRSDLEAFARKHDSERDAQDIVAELLQRRDAAAPVRILAMRAESAAPLPVKKHPQDSGYDIVAWWGTGDRAPRIASASFDIKTQRLQAENAFIDGERAGIRLWPGTSLATPIGWHLCAPEGYEIQARPRSGLGINCSVFSLFGTIDGLYVGETWTIVTNLNRDPFIVRRGDRIAQAVVAPVTPSELVLTDAMPTTPRGANGLGSTGVR